MNKNLFIKIKQLAVILIFIPFLVGFIPQESKVNQRKIEKEQKRRQKEAEKKYNQAKKDHKKMQSKETQTMMKKSQKESKKNTPMKPPGGKKCK